MIYCTSILAFYDKVVFKSMIINGCADLDDNMQHQAESTSRE